jgi:hypothetical protein
MAIEMTYLYVKREEKKTVSELWALIGSEGKRKEIDKLATRRSLPFFNV